VAQLDWTQGELLAVFPYRHQMELTATLRPDGLTFETTLNANMDGPVPVSFGFHPWARTLELRFSLRMPTMVPAALQSTL
jgi:galactose mutarotase-like enzyme